MVRTLYFLRPVEPHFTVNFRSGHSPYTLGKAYDEFGYNEHPAIKSRFIFKKIIDCNVKKFRYNETHLKQADVFASKSLTTMLNSSITMRTRL